MVDAAQLDTEPLGAGQRRDAEPVLGEAGDRLGDLLRTETDHQVVTGQHLSVDDHAACRGIDALHGPGAHLDAAPFQAAQRAGDLRRRPVPCHDPQVGGREREVLLPVDQDHPVTAVQPATQPVGRDDAADPTAQHQDRLRARGGGHQKTRTLSAAIVRSASSSIVERRA